MDVVLATTTHSKRDRTLKKLIVLLLFLFNILKMHLFQCVSYANLITIQLVKLQFETRLTGKSFSRNKRITNVYIKSCVKYKGITEAFIISLMLLFHFKYKMKLYET